MATLQDFINRIIRVLGADEDSYETALILDGINAGLDAIMPWTPNTATTYFTGDAVTKSFDLPADCYEVEAVVVRDSGEILQRAYLSPGIVFGDYFSGTNNWLDYPYGQLTFSKALATDDIYDLYYLAYWTKVNSTTPTETVITIPSPSELGVILYASAYTVWPAAVGAAEYGTFKNKVDSGNPEHNPMQKAATYLLNLFQQEMNRHPRYQKATK